MEILSNFHDQVEIVHNDTDGLFFSIHNFGVPIIILSSNGNILDINSIALDIYNCSSTEIIGKNVRTICDKEIPFFYSALLSRQNHLSDVCKTVAIINSEKVLISWSISKLCFQDSTVFMLSGNQKEDINDSKICFTSNDLKENCYCLLSEIANYLGEKVANKYNVNANLRDALKDMTSDFPGEIYCNAPSGLYIYCNEKYEKLYGLSSYRDLINRPAYFINNSMYKFIRNQWDLRIPKYWEDTSNIVRITKRPLIWHQDMTFKSYDSSNVVNPYSSKYPIFNDNKDVVGILGITIDVNNSSEFNELNTICRQMHNNINVKKNCFLNDLTAREIQCLGLIAHGKTAKMVANELAISSRTVESHIKNIFKKTNLYSRHQLISQYWKNGINS